MKTLLLLALMLLLADDLRAQPVRPPADRIRQHRFVHLTVEDGLSNGVVNAIAQDSAGFMWFGTENGLNRYDGRSFKAYFHIPSDSTSLPNSRITSLLTAPDGTLWVVTPLGLCSYNPRTDSFRRIALDPRYNATDGSMKHKRLGQIARSSDGTLWICSEYGISRYNPASKADNTPFPHITYTVNGTKPSNRFFAASIFIIPPKPTSGASPQNASPKERVLVNGVMEYILGEGGVYELDPKQMSFTLLADSIQITSYLADKKAFTGYYFERSNRHLLYQFDAETFAVQRTMDAPLEQNRSYNPFATSRDSIHYLTIDDGVQILNANTFASRVIACNPNFSESLLPPGVMIFDRSGVLWIGGGGGVSKYAPHQYKFTHFRHNPTDANSLLFGYARAMTEDIQGNLWVGEHFFGFNKIDRARNDRIQRFEKPCITPRPAAHRTVWSMSSDRNGLVWVRGADFNNTQIGVGITAEGKVVLPHKDWFGGKLPPLYITFLHNAGGVRDSILWALRKTANPKGLKRDPDNFPYYIPANGYGQWYLTKLLVPALPKSTPPVSAPLSSYKVLGDYSVPEEVLGTKVEVGHFRTVGALQAVDAEGTWYGLRDSVLVMWSPARDGNSVRKKVVKGAYTLTLASRLDNSVMVEGMLDSKGKLWFTCKGGGVLQVNPKTGESVSIGIAEGLPNMNAYGVLEDYRGNVWISTDAGLCEYNPETKQFRTFGLADGLQGREFNRLSSHKSPSGELFFGGINGVNAFFPEDTDPNPAPPLIALANLATPLRVLPSAMGDTLELPFEERSFRAEILALEYTDPKRNRVAWKLEGFDAEWHISETNDQDRRLNYTNLDAGAYRLIVKAANSDGVWSKPQCAVQLTILPAWWQTWWFRAAVAVVLLSLAYALFRWRVRIIQKRNLDLEYQVLARTAELGDANAELSFANVEIHEKNLELAENLEKLKRAQKQLVESEKMAALGTLVSGVAHELNTPIGVAVTAASTMQSRAKRFLERLEKNEPLLKQELRDFTADAAEGTAITLSNLARAADLIQSFKHVAVDQHTDQFRHFELGAYLHELARSLEPQWKGEQHRLEVCCAESILLESFPGAIAQIITNFVMNSLLHGFREYTENGVMTLRAEQHTETITLRFSDNGRGIPAEIVERIYDPFFTTKQAQGGTGLGLNIAYNLVTQKLGGTLVCQSTVGQGTTFTMTLPHALEHHTTTGVMRS